MTIRTRITLQFSIIVTVILILFSVVIYSLQANFRENEFTERLRDKALSAVTLLSDVDAVTNDLLKKIEQSLNNPLHEEKVFIYDYSNKLVFCSLAEDKDEIPAAVLNKIKKKGEIQYREKDIETVGFLFKGKYDHYIAIASANDVYSLSKLYYLRNILVTGVVCAIVLIVVIGLFFAKQTLQPISNMVNQVDQVTASKLNVRVDEGNAKDEIAQLAIKFNKMLERLHAAFEMQRSFVGNASHELRTPLTALTGQLEVTLMNEQISGEARVVLEALLFDIKQLNKLSNGLLDLAQAELDISEIRLVNLRIDELIGSARAELLKRHNDYHVIFNFSEFPDESWLTLKGNEQLLRSAILNALENACKYSNDQTARLDLSFTEQYVRLVVSDKGIGIKEEDLPRVFDPFYRAADAKNYNGSGIGLTLTKKIVELHGGNISINSVLKEGTTVQIELPHLV